MPENKILPLNETVSWIGVLDREIVTFDIVMETLFGTTYNSYFINADKKVVIDTVKKTRFLASLKQLIIKPIIKNAKIIFRRRHATSSMFIL